MHQGPQISVQPASSRKTGTFARLSNKNTIQFATFANLFRSYTEQMQAAVWE
jgi:hypothetical protein